jgi:hypothetical protein
MLNAIKSIFAPKKKQEPQMSMAPVNQSNANMSVYRPPTQPAVQKSNYNTQNYISSMFKQPTASAPKTQPQQSVNKQPVKIQTPNLLPWGTNTGAMPWGLKQPSTPKPNVQKQGPMNKVPQMSVAPKLNMSVNPNARLTSPPPQAQETPMRQADPTSEWMKYIMGTGERQKSLAEQQRDETMNFLREQGQLTGQYLQDQIPVAQEGFNQFKDNTEATIADLIAGGEMQKGQAEDYYGDAQRQSAQTLRETQGQQQREFAALGSLDSFGEGSFSEANTNVMSEFNRVTQQNLKAKADKLTEIDMSVKQAERQARQAIVQEEQKLKQLERDIQFAIANNDLETANGLKQAYLQSQQLIYDIEDTMAQTRYAFAMEQQNLQNELAKINSFTPEFMSTGVPTNQAEYEFLVKNKDAMSGLYGGGENVLISTIANTVVDDVARALDIIETRGRGAAGWGGLLAGVPESDARALDQLIKSVQSNIGIDKLLEIKASGAGLGQVPQSQLEMLASVLGSLNLKDKPENLIYNLNRVDTLYKDIIQRAGGQVTAPSALAREGQSTTNLNQFIR